MCSVSLLGKSVWGRAGSVVVIPDLRNSDGWLA